MIIELKQYLNGENDSFPIQLSQLSKSNEGYLIWRNQIFKIRRLQEYQIKKIYDLFYNCYLQNLPQIEENENLIEFLSLCNLCSNFTEGKYIEWNEIYKKLIEQKKSFIYEKLVILGQYELLIQQSDYSIIQNMQQQYLKKFIKFILINKIELWKQYENIIKPDLILGLCLNAKVKQNTESIMFDIIKNCKQEQQIFDNLVMNWSNKYFMINASFKTQIYCSNLINLFIQEGFHNDLIHVGIQKRLNSQTAIPRKCGMMVWKQFVKTLKIDTNCEIEELQEDEINEIWNKDDKKIEIKNQNTIVQQSNEFYDFEEDNLLTEQSIVKNLYDCLLALRSDDNNRIDAALKHLPYLIRNGLDIHIHGEQICDILLLGRDWKESQEPLRIQALISLCIMSTQITDRLIQQYFGEEISLMQRIYILKVIRESAIELSSNPKKYPLELFDKFEKQENSQFLFKQITTHYNDKSTISQSKTQPISRRWGHTKRAYEGLQLIQPYVNRFHQLTEHFYFPLLIYSQSKHKLLLMRESILLINLIEVILKMLDCASNAIHCKKLISEALDFLIIFEKNKNLDIILLKLQVILKIVVLLKGEFDDRITQILPKLKYDDQKAMKLYDLIISYL